MGWLLLLAKRGSRSACDMLSTYTRRLARHPAPLIAFICVCGYSAASQQSRYRVCVAAPHNTRCPCLQAAGC